MKGQWCLNTDDYRHSIMGKTFWLSPRPKIDQFVSWPDFSMGASQLWHLPIMTNSRCFRTFHCLALLLLQMNLCAFLKNVVIFSHNHSLPDMAELSAPCIALWAFIKPLMCLARSLPIGNITHLHQVELLWPHVSRLLLYSLQPLTSHATIHSTQF